MPGIADRFRRARDDPSLVVVEGFHPLKHALRFGAELLVVITDDPAAVLSLAATLAADVLPDLEGRLVPVGRAEFAGAAPSPPPTRVLALARRPPVDPTRVLAAPGGAPVIFLDRPNHLGNLGAVVRVAAAAEAGGVLTSGDRDPWHPAALRGSAGLHFALPVARVESLPPGDRPVVAIDPEGSSLWELALPPRAVLAFGGERHGLSPLLRERARLSIAIPMRPGVSSLNLATAAAVVLFAAGRPRSASAGR
jgi:TrmH family RNA methyltransferase